MITRIIIIIAIIFCCSQNLFSSGKYGAGFSTSLNKINIEFSFLTKVNIPNYFSIFNKDSFRIELKDVHINFVKSPITGKMDYTLNLQNFVLYGLGITGGGNLIEALYCVSSGRLYTNISEQMDLFIGNTIDNFLLSKEWWIQNSTSIGISTQTNNYEIRFPIGFVVAISNEKPQYYYSIGIECAFY